MVVTRRGEYRLADPNTALGAGADSLYSPLRGGLNYENPLDQIGDTAQQAGDMLTDKIEDVVELIKALTGIDLGVLTQFMPFLEGAVTDTFDALEAAGQWIVDILNPTGAINATIDPNSPLNAANLYGQLPDWMRSAIPLGSLSPLVGNILPNPYLEGADPIDGLGEWTLDPAVRHVNVGNSAHTTGNGSLRTLLSDPPTEVFPGQVLTIGYWVKWAAIPAGITGAAFTLGLNTYATRNAAGAPVAQPVLDTITGPAVSSSNPVHNDFVELVGTYTVPPGVASVRLRLEQAPAVTGGGSWWHDGRINPTGLILQDWIDGLPDQINMMVDDTQDTLNGIWVGIFGEVPAGAVAVNDIIDALQNIPGTNVTGLQGGNVIDTIQQTVDVLWNGFARLFGFSGKSIADVATQASDTVATAQNSLELAEWNNALLGVRNNKSLMEGMDETSESNFLMSEMFSGGADPTGVISATSASVPMAFWRAKELAHKGVISWFGKGFTNVTNLFIDIYKFNPATSTLELLHSSGDQVGQVTASWKLCRYFMSTANRFDVTNADVIAVAWRVVGTGTHSIGGKLAGSWLPDDTAVVPARPAATRTGVGNLAYGSITYSGNVPWFGIGIAAGDVPPDFHADRSMAFTNPGPFTYPIPEWATHIDEIHLGAGGGGAGGDPFLFLSGGGGYAGSWATRTLVRGVDFPPGTTQLTGTIGAGGAGGFAPSGAGGDGSATTRNAIAGGDPLRSAAGGGGNTHYDNEGFGDAYGDSPGDVTYNSVPYQGGAAASPGIPGAPGQAPGGGGGGGLGGTWGVAGSGGAGARGGAWYVARQVSP